jgi:hypothetical protein
MKQYTSTGKQVLRDGLHFADAVNVEEAAQIAHAMNEGLARVIVELGECRTCKGVGGHQPNCVDRPKAA